MSTIYLSLGSNIGDRRQQLTDAVRLLREQAQVKKVSSVYETAPVGGVEQDDFYNICVELESDQTPEEVLAMCQSIERQLNRVRKIHWGPRTIDLDILMIDDDIIEREDLKVPHPYMLERGFVLIPLAEIAPEAVHPKTNKLIKELVQEDKEVRKTEVRL